MSETRVEIERLYTEGHSGREIARRLNLHHSTVQSHIGRLARTKEAALAPLTGVVPEGFHLSSVATTVDKDGNVRSQSYRAKSGEEGDVVPESGSFPAPDGMFVRSVSSLVDGQTGAVKQQWVKSDKVKETLAGQLVDAIRGAFSDCARLPEIPAPGRSNSGLMTIYPMGDPHLGMYAWAAETGADFDLAIAERNLVAATRRLVAIAPASERALIANVGDFFHSDNQLNRTMRSGNALDVDTRWAKVLRVGVRTQRANIDAALEKHDVVEVVNEIGNHDDHTSQMLTLALSMFYENNPRVIFNDSPAKFHYHVFGKNLIGVTHGDTVKPEDLGEIMATDRPVDWGATLHRLWLTGHIHTRRVFELRGCMVESFRTLAAPDAWSMGAGYRSGRDMHCIVLDKEDGEIERHRIDIRAIERTLH